MVAYVLGGLGGFCCCLRLGILGHSATPHAQTYPPIHKTHPQKQNSIGGLIPDHYFARNEDVFRNAVRPSHPGVRDAYAAVTEAARRLCALVVEVSFYTVRVYVCLFMWAWTIERASERRVRMVFFFFLISIDPHACAYTSNTPHPKKQINARNNLGLRPRL